MQTGLRRQLARLYGFGRLTWKGALIGNLIVAETILFLAGYYIQTGLGTALDIIILMIGAHAASVILWRTSYWLLKWTRLPLPWHFWIGSALSGVTIYMVLEQFHTGNRAEIFFTIYGLAFGTFTGAAFALYAARPNSNWSKGLAAAAVVWLGFNVLWSVTPGHDLYRYEQLEKPQALDDLQALPHPAAYGDHGVLIRTYGSGDTRPRPEFGKQADYVTGTVDGSKIVSKWNWLRSLYWGFDEKELPVNGTLYLPEGDGPFPLVLIVHGNHKMEEFSDPGYVYLTEMLASRGFAAVSVDENFLNGSWSKGINGDYRMRAIMLLEHLKWFEQWNGDAQHELYEKIDMDHISLIGHSRGGQAVAMAAVYNELKQDPKDADQQWDYHFSIDSVVAIAPTDAATGDQAAVVKDVSYLVIQGAHDSDVNWFSGDRQYDRVKFTTDAPFHFKSSLYVEGANHGQFNMVWGDTDLTFPRSLFINRGALMSGEEQREIAKTWIGAFLEVTLRDRLAYLPMFQDYRHGLSWLPDRVYVQRYADSLMRSICDFEEDDKLGTCGYGRAAIEARHVTGWKEAELESRNDSGKRRNDVVYLTWQAGQGGQYVIDLERLDQADPLLAYDGLTFDISRVTDVVRPAVLTEEDTRPLAIELVAVDGQGNKASLQFEEGIGVPPVIRTPFMKTEWLDKWVKNGYLGNDSEEVLQTLRFDRQQFENQNPAFDWDTLQQIIFQFPTEYGGQIALDQIGFIRTNNGIDGR
ncbi:hypothetical protein [Marinicrinis sediminis]|uniref:Alpha/beta hydrolase n=1 Tax=Marinicrinis sediminis TaxID=1652465 RepID=A0ABW5R8C5_9BACL